MSWPRTHTKFSLGDRVQKDRGSSWHGQVVGWYRTSFTPEGYCVESDREPGSVQIYPAVALRLISLAEDYGMTPSECAEALCSKT
jgi:hypothetical protein